MVFGSRQGLRIAFVGMNDRAQTACAEYISHKYLFKRVNMDEGLRYFLTKMYGYKSHRKVTIKERRAFYDSIYKIDPEIFISHIKLRVKLSEKDLVIFDVRYLNEMKALQELGFKIVRVTAPTRPHVGVYVNSTIPGTVALASMYDKSFAFKNNVEYSVHFTGRLGLPATIDPLLTAMGYEIQQNLTNMV